MVPSIYGMQHYCKENKSEGTIKIFTYEAYKRLNYGLHPVHFYTLA